MITDYDGLTDEQREVISEFMKLKMLKGMRAYQNKGTPLYRKLVKAGIGKSGVASLHIKAFHRSNPNGKLVVIESPRITFVKMFVTNDEYDQLLGVI